MRILCTNDDGIHAPGLKTPRSDRARICRTTSGWWRPKRIRAASRIRCRSTIRCGCAKSPTGISRSRARRPIASSWACAISCTSTARSRSLRRQPRPERRRGRELFGHGRGRHRGHDPRRARRSRSRRPTAPAGATNAKWHCAEPHGPAIVRKHPRSRHREGHSGQRQLPRLRARRSRGRGGRQPGLRNQELLRLDERTDGRGNPYYWIAFERRRFTPGNGTDLWAIANRRIAITPLRLDMTDEPTLTRYAQACSTRKTPTADDRQNSASEPDAFAVRRGRAGL